MSETYHDKISAFIDNEMSHDAEQDFLISLASNDGVRRAFRSELVMKNVIHQDEIATQPRRDLRAVLLGTLGVGTTAAVTQQAAASGVLQSLFASKVGALVVAGLVTVSAAGGYVAHSIISPSEPSVITRTIIQPTSEAPRQVEPAPIVSEPVTQAVTKAPAKAAKTTKRKPVVTSEPAAAEPATSGTGSVTIEDSK